MAFRCKPACMQGKGLQWISHAWPACALQEEQKGTIDGELATVLSSIALACKQIASLVTRAGISNLTGLGGLSNSSVSTWHNSSWHTYAGTYAACSHGNSGIINIAAPCTGLLRSRLQGCIRQDVNCECYQVCSMRLTPQAVAKACFWTVHRATSALCCPHQAALVTCALRASHL